MKENKIKFPKIFSKNINATSWDEWLELIDKELNNAGYRKYKQIIKSSDFQYWKSFYADNEKIYIVGLLFYDFRKYQSQDPNANIISIDYECMLLDGFGGRVDMSVSRNIKLEKFEKMSKDFHDAMLKYIKKKL